MKVEKFAALFVLLISLATCGLSDMTAAPIARNGTIDLRQQSLSESIPLNGQWDFHWKVQDSSLKQLSEEGQGSEFYFKQRFIKGKEIERQDAAKLASVAIKPFLPDQLYKKISQYLSSDTLA